MVRDIRADAVYFERAVASTQRSAERKARELELPVELHRYPDFLAAVANGAAWNRSKEFSSRYSRGDSATELRATFDSWLDYAERAAIEKAKPVGAELRAAQDIPNGVLPMYVSRLWLVSLAHVFVVDDATFARVVEAVRPLLADRLVSSLVAVRDPQVPVAEDDWHPKRFGALADVFSLPDEKRPAAIGTYLDRWYPRMRGLEWWDGHKYLSKVHYVGYWSFESAGVVAALGVDDASFRGNEYYPAELIPAARAASGAA